MSGASQATLAAEEPQAVDPAEDPSPAVEDDAAAGPHENGSAPQTDEVPSAAPEQHTAIRAVKTLEDATPLLRRPFTKEAVKWKVQTVLGDAAGCHVVGYIDARLVIERLNAVIPRWQEEFEALQDSTMRCSITIDGVTHTDVGSGYKGKGLYSDALKRAAVHFGVGVSVYALREVTFWVSDHGKPQNDDYGALIETYTSKGKKAIKITAEGQRWLRDMYQRWLEAKGIAAFGQPIDHGDVEGSAGDDAETAAAQEDVSDLPAVKVPLTDEKAHVLQGTCREIWRSLPNKRVLPAARFESELRQASTSHDDLEAFAKKLRELAG